MESSPPSATNFAPVQPGKTVYALVQPVDYTLAAVRVFSTREDAVEAFKEMGSPYYWSITPLIVE